MRIDGTAQEPDVTRMSIKALSIALLHQRTGAGQKGAALPLP